LFAASPLGHVVRDADVAAFLRRQFDGVPPRRDPPHVSVRLAHPELEVVAVVGVTRLHVASDAFERLLEGRTVAVVDPVDERHRLLVQLHDGSAPHVLVCGVDVRHLREVRLRQVDHLVDPVGDQPEPAFALPNGAFASDSCQRGGGVIRQRSREFEHSVVDGRVVCVVFVTAGDEESSFAQRQCDRRLEGANRPRRRLGRLPLEQVVADLF